MLDYLPAQWERQNAADSLHADLTLTITGTGVTPAEGSVKPIAGFTFNFG
jgi:hypothetical protein